MQKYLFCFIMFAAPLALSLSAFGAEEAQDELKKGLEILNEYLAHEKEALEKPKNNTEADNKRSPEEINKAKEKFTEVEKRVRNLGLTLPTNSSKYPEETKELREKIVLLQKSIESARMHLERVEAIGIKFNAKDDPQKQEELKQKTQLINEEIAVHVAHLAEIKRQLLHEIRTLELKELKKK